LVVVNKNPEEDIVVLSKSEWDSLQETLAVARNAYLSQKVLRGMAQVKAGQTQERNLIEAD
ncbi:type II toxin-antitoxin system Phd/YefM family antitoxin, partial [Streptococcus suis]